MNDVELGVSLNKYILYPRLILRTMNQGKSFFMIEYDAFLDSTSINPLSSTMSFIAGDFAFFNITLILSILSCYGGPIPRDHIELASLPAAAESFPWSGFPCGQHVAMGRETSGLIGHQCSDDPGGLTSGAILLIYWEACPNPS